MSSNSGCLMSYSVCVRTERAYANTRPVSTRILLPTLRIRAKLPIDT
jgi:hypothetical protein